MRRTPPIPAVLLASLLVTSTSTAPAQAPRPPRNVNEVRDFRLPLLITNIKRSQQRLPQSPWFAPGGDLTVFTCTLADDETASFIFAIQESVPPENGPFAEGFLLPRDRESGDRVLAAVCLGLRADPPPPKPAAPLAPVPLSIQSSGPTPNPPLMSRREAAGGNWTVLSARSADERLPGRFKLTYDLKLARAELSATSRKEVAQLPPFFAAALRDGLRTRRTPDTDPNITLDGPTLRDVRTLPNSTRLRLQFLPNSQRLLATEQTPEGHTAFSLIDPASPDKPQPVGRLPFQASFWTPDPDARRMLLVRQDVQVKPNDEIDARRSIYWWDRTAGPDAQPQRVDGPWRDAPSLYGPWAEGAAPVSPDGRYAIVFWWLPKDMKNRGNEKQTSWTYVIDTQTLTHRRVDLPDVATAEGWTDQGANLRAVLRIGYPVDRTPPGHTPTPARTCLIDPATLAVEWPADPLPQVDPRLSPDGKLRLEGTEEGGQPSLVDVATGTRRPLPLHDDDRPFVSPYRLAWAGPNHLAWRLAGWPALLDARTMKLTFVTDPDDHLDWQYAPDLQLAISHSPEGWKLARLSEGP